MSLRSTEIHLRRVHQDPSLVRGDPRFEGAGSWALSPDASWSPWDRKREQNFWGMATRLRSYECGYATIGVVRYATIGVVR